MRAIATRTTKRRHLMLNWTMRSIMDVSLVVVSADAVFQQCGFQGEASLGRNNIAFGQSIDHFDHVCALCTERDFLSREVGFSRSNENEVLPIDHLNRCVGYN